MNHETIKPRGKNAAPSRRRSYTINPSFQWKYTLMTVATVFVLAGLLTVVLYNTLHQQARARVMTPMVVSTTDNLTMIGLSAAAFALVVGVALTLSVFVFTHRIAGPMFVIGRSLEQLSAGKLPIMRPLRRTDEFKDVHDALRATVDRLREDRGRAVEEMTELYNLTQTVAENSDTVAQGLCEELLARIDRQRNTAIAALGEPNGDQATSVASPSSDAATDLAGAALG